MGAETVLWAVESVTYPMLCGCLMRRMFMITQVKKKLKWRIQSCVNSLHVLGRGCTRSKDHVYRMWKVKYSNIWPNQTIVSDQSELTILLCQPMNSLLLMKTSLPWYSSLQLLPSYIWSLPSHHTRLQNHDPTVLVHLSQLLFSHASTV